MCAQLLSHALSSLWNFPQIVHLNKRFRCYHAVFLSLMRLLCAVATIWKNDILRVEFFWGVVISYPFLFTPVYLTGFPRKIWTWLQNIGFHTLGTYSAATFIVSSHNFLNSLLMVRLHPQDRKSSLHYKQSCSKSANLLFFQTKANLWNFNSRKNTISFSKKENSRLIEFTSTCNTTEPIGPN